MDCSQLAGTIALISVIALSGCATQAQRQFQAMRQGNQQHLAQMKVCATAVYNSPEYAALRPHAPINLADATLQQLSDASVATPEEVQAIFATHPRFKECRKNLLNGVAQSEPTLVPILIASYNKTEDDLLAVIQGHMTWGDYVTRARDQAVETQLTLQTADQRVVSELKRENQAEIAQRQRAAEALAAWAQTQQLINAANRPVVTNCSGFGNMVNCVSR